MAVVYQYLTMYECFGTMCSGTCIYSVCTCAWFYMVTSFCDIWLFSVDL